MGVQLKQHAMDDPNLTYDQVPYSSFTFPQTRPDRLATLAAFYGMDPAPPDRCRVLELGCGDGTNLASFAHILPESEFVGIDLSKVHIDLAKNTASELRLSNLEFICDDVMNVSRERFGEFDYIIAHGLFSWVPDFVREKVLQIYSECLAEQGVGYVSYNAYPGCKLREMLWDMMKYYTSGVEDPMQKVAGGIQYLNFLNFAAEKETAYQTVINAELSLYSQRTAENVFHDDFSPLNRPFYFHEFVGLIAEKGLQFLSEVDAFWTESNLRPEIAAKLDELDDVVKREQFADFIKGRPFRSSLICRASISLDRGPKAEILRSFYLASQVEPAPSTPNAGGSETAANFRSVEGNEFSVASPLTGTILTLLHSAWSRCIALEELLDNASRITGLFDQASIDAALDELLGLFKKGYVYLHRFKPEFPVEPSERPTASRFAQWQIRKKCADITALSGMNLKPDSDLMNLLLLLCDGSRTRPQLLDEMARRVQVPGEQREAFLRELPEIVEQKLIDFARLGLLES